MELDGGDYKFVKLDRFDVKKILERAKNAYSYGGISKVAKLLEV